MPQTVYDTGDPITSRLSLGVTHDGTTTVAVAVYRPDGTAVAAPGMSGWLAGEERTAQFYATNDGLAGSAVDAADGDWVAVWTVGGTGAGVQAKVYNVRALAGASDRRPAWAPFLSDVADHVPRLTIDVATPGSAIELGTFNGLTAPTDEQAQRHVDQAVASIVAAAGVVTGDGVQQQARASAALRAAASIQRAWPRSAEDRAAADALDRRADAEFGRLLTAIAATAGSTSVPSALPQYAFPTPVKWGDLNL